MFSDMWFTSLSVCTIMLSSCGCNGYFFPSQSPKHYLKNRVDELGHTIGSPEMQSIKGDQMI